MATLFTNNGDPDQVLHSVASDLCLLCLLITLLVVPRLKWVKKTITLAMLKPAYSMHL